jgi:hypothetical protein|tara:strand:+ start:431 stop:796 length:366 start_codon:yes stop_codon:yes gene_type:complete
VEDKQKIEEGVQLYFDSMYESSAEKVRQAFHENAMITGYMETGLAEMTVDQFAKFVEGQQPSPKEKGEDVLLEILSCEIAGETAYVRVRDGYIGHVFVDTLSFLKKDDEWRIYNKLFHVES